MLRVYRSNRAEKLVDVLAAVLGEAPLPPMDTEWLVVSNVGTGVWLQRELANRLRIFAGAVFPFPREVLNAICFGAAEESPYREETVTLTIFETLPELLDTPPFRDLRRYLSDDDASAKRMGLAGKIAHAFAEYALYRPEMVLKWETHTGGDWQAHLWRRVVQQLGPKHIARGAVDFLRNDMPLLRPRPPFKRLLFFGQPGLPPLYLSVLRALSADVDIHLFALSPSAEWWADIRSKPAVEPQLLPGDEADDWPEAENPFLAALGKVGRDFQRLLEETVPYEEHPADLYVDPRQSTDVTALAALQSDMLHLQFNTDTERPLDNSIRIQSCHTPEREVEVLKDQILDVIDRSEGRISPDDILVIAPDMGPFAPFVEGVFATGAHPLPFNLTERPERTIEVTRAFLSVLALHGSRLTVAEVLDLLAFAPIRDKFNLDESDTLEAERWIRESEVRWGVDAVHRTAHGQPDFRENSWRFGIDRLMLGLSVGNDAGCFGDAAPAAFLSGDDAKPLGRLAAFLETLFSVLKHFETPRPLAEWLTLLGDVCGRLLDRGASFESGHQRIAQAFELLDRAAESAQQSAPIPFAAARRPVVDSLTSMEGIKGWRPHGITFSDFSTLSGVPFKVIALIGMNEGTFPRRRAAPRFDLIAKTPKLGDRQVTSDDRYCFLTTLMSVRETLIISFEGQDLRNNAPKPPSVVVSELLENVSRCFDCTERPLPVPHPLQPFSSRYFETDTDDTLFSYDRVGLVGAVSCQSPPSDKAPFFEAPLPAPAPEPVIALDALARFLAKPAGYLLRHRLGLLFPREEASVETREPVERGRTEDHTILRALVREGGRGKDPTSLYNHFRARGLLPHGPAGRIRFERLSHEATPIIDDVRKIAAGEPLEPVPVDLTVTTSDGDTRIVGVLSQVWPTAQLSFGYAHLTGTRLIRLWIHHLALSALGDAALPEKSVVIGRQTGGKAGRITLLDPMTDPLTLLGDLATLYRIGLTRPLHLIPRLSHAFAEPMDKHDDRRRARRQAAGLWQQGFEASDPWYQVAFRGVDPLGPDPLGDGTALTLGFENLADRVFSPLLEAVDKGAL